MNGADTAGVGIRLGKAVGLAVMPALGEGVIVAVAVGVAEGVFGPCSVPILGEFPPPGGYLTPRHAGPASALFS